MRNKKRDNLDVVPIEQIIDDMFKSANDALDNKDDAEMQSIIALHGRAKVFAMLLGGMVRSANHKGLGADFDLAERKPHSLN